MVGEHLNNILTSLAVTPEDFADSIGVGKSTIYKLLRGDTKKFTVSMAKKISEVYGEYSIEYLLSLNNRGYDKKADESYFENGKVAKNEYEIKYFKLLEEHQKLHKENNRLLKENFKLKNRLEEYQKSESKSKASG